MDNQSKNVSTDTQLESVPENTQSKNATEDSKDTKSRKWQLTINNPQDKGLDHDAIKRLLDLFKSCLYWCMADEIGLEAQTPHTHIFLYLKYPVLFSTVKKRFLNMAHIEAARASCRDNRNYILKEGKHADTDKAETSVPGTFEESGPVPDEPGQGARTDLEVLYYQIKEGMTNAEILEAYPASVKYINLMDKVRQDVLEARYREEWRDLDVTYIWGPTATGKTRGVMEKHGYGNVYRVTDYKHPFDRYAQEPVLCLDEYRSSLQIGDMLDYLDGYPLALPARYANRQACYEQVYIISNIDLYQQYPNVQANEPETWKAFLRRIHHVIEYRANSPPIDHGNAMEYIFPPPPPVPDWVNEAEQAEQEELPF